MRRLRLKQSLMGIGIVFLWQWSSSAFLCEYRES